MKTYTTIEFFRDEEEIHAKIVNNEKKVGDFCIVGDWKNEEDIRISLENEASRLGYIKNKITLKNNMKRETFTREEVLKLIDEAFWDGVYTDNDEEAGEFFIADDYLLKFDKENDK